MSQAKRSPAVQRANGKAEMLRREISHMDRAISGKTTLMNQAHRAGREREALNITDEIRRLLNDRESKKTALMRLEQALGQHSKVSDLAETQDSVKELTLETKSLAIKLDIDDISETNMEARVVDGELEEMLNRIGLNTEDRQEQDKANVDLMHSLLETAPPMVAPQQQRQQQRRVNTNTNINTNHNGGGTRYRSQIEDMLL